MLYLSLYFKTYRQHYYDLLNKVRLEGDWEAWLYFFAEAVVSTATQAMGTAQALASLTKKDRDKIAGVGRAATSTLRIHQAMLERPLATAGWLSTKTGLTPATVNKCLAHLGRLNIIRELTSRRRNRIFSYAQYIEILNQGMDIPEP